MCLVIYIYIFLQVVALDVSSYINLYIFAVLCEDELVQ
jgi:hypothetical protein